MTANLIACHECDLLQQAVLPSAGGAVRCRRCNALLYRSHPHALERSLALALGALVLFIISNAFPIIGIEVAGERVDATLLGTIHAVYKDGMWVVAFLMLMTTVLAPLMQIMAMLTVLLSLCAGNRSGHLEAILRLWIFTRRWAMIEVFFLGVLVSLVKLSHLASVILGTAFWAMAGLILALTFAGRAFDTRLLWQQSLPDDRS
jgi:paraquat-inducible protein A